MSQRKPYSTRSTSAEPSTSSPKKPSHSHSHSHSHDHGHGHSHGPFSSHNHDHSEGAGEIMKALTGVKRDKGSRITLIGLASNVGLTAAKGAAGILMNSASLLAEAGHSFSDLLGDFVTLACWKISRRPPSADYPWGYGKYETIGTLGVSLILVGGAIGIALHSYHLLLQVMLPYLNSLDPSSSLAQIVPYLPKSIPSPLLELFHDHSSHAGGGHNHSHTHTDAGDILGGASAAELEGAVLNPHAAWFALMSVVIKEWLFRATKKVADEEHSPVLLANALHHRSDALTSGVALFSILGSAAGAPVLDPLGGLAVSFVILKQGLELSKVAALELLDKGVDDDYRREIEDVIAPMFEGDVERTLEKGEGLMGVRNIRAVKSGGLSSIDLTILVPSQMSVRDSHEIESKVREAIMSERRDAREVKIHIHGVDSAELEDWKKSGVNGESDFGRGGCRD